MSSSAIQVLWLRPSTGKNVSTRRTRIAEQLESSCVSVTFHNMSPLNPHSGIRSLLAMEYDIVIANVRFPLYASFPLTKLLQQPLIADVSDPITHISDLPTPIYDIIRKYEWWIIQHADAAVFAESESYNRAISLDVNSTLAKNAVNYNMFLNPSENIKEYALKELRSAGVDIDAPIAIYPGRFAPAYHIKEMLAAARIATDWQFVFLGEEMEQERVEKTSQHEQNVYYLGSYSHKYIPGFLYHSDVGLCLVDVERPLKILEYGAAKLPVMGMPGDLEIEFSDEELWFVNPNPEDIVQGLDRIQNNPSKAEKKSKNLCQTAYENSWEEVAKAYREIIRKILNK